MDLLDLTSYSFNPYAIPPLVAGILLTILFLTVWIREGPSLLSSIFGILILCGMVWLFSYVGIYSARHEALALQWVRIENAAVVFIPSFLYLFAVAAVHRFREFRIWAFLGLAFSCGFLILLFSTDHFVAGVYRYSWGYYARYRPWSFSFLVFFFAFMAWSLQLFWEAFHRAASMTKRFRFRRMFSAFGIALFGSIDYLAAYGIPVYPFGYVFGLIFFAVLMPTILRFRLEEVSPSEKMAQEVKRETLTWALVGLTLVVSLGLLGVYAFRLASSSLEHLVRLHNQAAGTMPVEEVYALIHRLGLYLALGVSFITFVAFIAVVATARRGERNRRRNQLLASIVDSSDDAIIGKTLEGVIVSWNPGAERLYGYKAREVINQNISLLIPPGRSEELVTIMERLKLEKNVVTYETKWLHKDGRPIHVALTLSAIRDANGRISGAVSISKDMTYLKRVEEELGEKNEALEQLAKELQERTRRLERFHHLTVDRELEMKRMKQEINALLEKTGQPRKY